MQIQKSELPDAPRFYGNQGDHARMFEMIMGYRISQIVRAIAEFSIAELLESGPASAEEIASARSLDLDATLRLMRTCVALGMATYEDYRFASTSLLRVLHKDDTKSLRDLSLSVTAPSHWLPWGRFTAAISSGQAQSHAALGCTPWEYLAKHPEIAEIFHRLMGRMTVLVSRDVAEIIDTKSITRGIDLGGGDGTLIIELMKKNAALHGEVLDLPAVLPAAIVSAQNAGFSDRFSALAGNFLEFVPPSRLYLLKWILHDWNDTSCISILRNCRRSIEADGRLVIVEVLIGECVTPIDVHLTDLTMLVLLGGKERNIDEYRALLAAADFELLRHTPTSTPFFVLEANPI